MKTLVSGLMAFVLFSATGCDEARTTTDRDRTTTDRDVAPTDKNRDMPARGPTAGAADRGDARDKADQDAADRDLPAGVEEKPADELPKPDSEDKQE